MEQVYAQKERLAAQTAQLREEVEEAHREQHDWLAFSQASLTVPACTVEAAGGFGRPGLHDEVERRYPFPIAYCFRSLRAELNPTDRWLALYELYTLIIRYVTFVLLAEQSRSGDPFPDELQSRIRKLRFGSGGDWGRACVGLLERLRSLPDNKTCFRALRDNIARDAQANFEGTAFDADILKSFELESKDLVKDRNRSFGHGFRGTKEDAQHLYEHHLPGIKAMLGVIAPLADFILFRPIQILANVGGQCVFVSKILMGSNPLFLVEEMSGKNVPETVCQLLLPDDVQSTISLHPWLDLTNCEKCGRDMMFIYDALFSDLASEKVLFLEYPSNHEKHRPDLCSWVRRALGN